MAGGPPQGADSKAELSMQGALGVHVCGRDPEEAAWAQGDVELQGEPDEGLGDTQEALVLERPFRVGWDTATLCTDQSMGVGPQKGATWAAGAHPWRAGQPKTICQQHPSSWDNKSSDQGDLGSTLQGPRHHPVCSEGRKGSNEPPGSIMRASLRQV